MAPSRPGQMCWANDTGSVAEAGAVAEKRSNGVTVGAEDTVSPTQFVQVNLSLT